MRDCDHCQLMRNGDCAGLDCHGFKPVGYIDSDILKNAADRVDADRHNRSRYSSRRVQESEERIRKTKQFDSANLISPSSKLTKGQILWYKNKFTGEICSGVIRAVGTDHMRFRFQDREVWLDYSVVNTRLFYTREDAERYGTLKKAGN